MSNRTLIVLILSALAVAACAHQPSSAAPGVPGFLLGLVHGFIALFSLIGSLFTDVRIYAVPNAGGWYDFGFVLGASIFFGGGGVSAKFRRGRA